MHVEEGRLFAPLGAAKGSGLYRFDPATGEADQKPYLATQGNVNKLLPLEE